MKRLSKLDINTPELTEHKFKEEWKHEVHEIDRPRFELLASKFKGGKYLDLGCFNSPIPGELDGEIWALDHSEYVTTYMQMKFPKVNYICGDVYDLPFKDGYFDYVVAGEILEHLEEPSRFIAEGMRVLKKGGTFALSTPKEEGVIQPSIGGAEHLWSFSPQDMHDLMGQYGELKMQDYKDSAITMVVWVTKK